MRPKGANIVFFPRLLCYNTPNNIFLFEKTQKFKLGNLVQGGGLSKSTSFNGGVVVQIFILNRNSTMYYLGGLLSINWNFEKVPGTI